MKKLIRNKKPYVMALLAGLILILLVTAFTPVPQSTSAAVPPPDDAPAYCSALLDVYIVNKYGVKSPLPDGTKLYRVAGDRVNLFVGNLPTDTEITPTIRGLYNNRLEISYDRFGNFNTEGYYSFYAAPGTYSVGYDLTKDQFEACGGSSAFPNAIEYKDTVFIPSIYIIINVLAPTPQPRNASPPAALPV